VVVVLQVVGGGKRKQVDATHVPIIADYKRGRDLNSPLAQAVPESNNGGRVWWRWRWRRRRRRRRRRKDHGMEDGDRLHHKKCLSSCKK
jgi:hypothetical protein